MRLFQRLSPRELLSHAVGIANELDETVKSLSSPEEYDDALSDFEYTGMGPRGYFNVTISDIPALVDALDSRCKTRKARDTSHRLESFC